MGKVKKPGAVKLIIGFIFKEEKIFNQTRRLLEKKFGKIDFESQNLLFTHTNYYEKELGRNLKRSFISFKKLIPAENLPKIKITTNKFESKMSKGPSRLINIDPGYLDLAKLVLASTKDYIHRVYLNRGIYAEVTLFYENKSFRPREWTYPDYKTSEYIAMFNQIRDIYARQSKQCTLPI